MTNWNLIRAFYKMNHHEIMNAHPSQWGVDPYWWEDVFAMTPIEESMWSNIRYSGVVMYPQYPVGKYFVDFGNPKFRIAIECDGKQWHDPVKDRERDMKLMDDGWLVIRFTGSECYADGIDRDDGYEMCRAEKVLSEMRQQQLGNHCFASVDNFSVLRS